MEDIHPAAGVFNNGNESFPGYLTIDNQEESVYDYFSVPEVVVTATGTGAQIRQQWYCIRKF